jgi:acetoacetate decarboxylase
MGLVRTPEEIAAIQATLSAPRFPSAQMLSVSFLTRPEIVGHILPPPLEPAAEPLVSAMVGRWRSNCVADYDGGAIYVSATHEGTEATYVLAMYMSSDYAIVFGRDLFGEPKKQSTSRLSRTGSRMSGWIDRGVRLIEIEADLTTDNGPVETSGANFNFKAQPSSDGIGLEADAVLTLAEFDMSLTTNLSGTGAVKLGGTVHDPLDEIEVVEVLGAAYIEGTLDARCRSIATTPAEDFLPFALGRLDYWPALDTSGHPLLEQSMVASP